MTGGGDYGFSATNYKVSEISSFGCVSVKSVVKAGSGVVYWGSNGIYLIEKNNLGEFEVKNLTDGTIQKFYDEISFQEKELSQAVYDDFNKTIRWNYTNSYGFVQQSSVKELILDTKLGAFYYYNIASPTIISLRSVFATPQSKTTIEDSPVLVGSSTINSLTDLVVVPYERRSPSQSSIKYVAFETYGNNVLLCFAYYHNQEFKVWGSVIAFDGVDAKAYLLTGGIVAGDSSVNKQAPYISVHFYRTENGVDESFFPTNQSGCLMRSQWGWSNSPNSNKWGQLQQVYRYRTPYFVSSLTDPFDTGFEIITTKNKIRGVGKSVSIYFETEPGKDCKLVGWNININGNPIT